MRRFDQGALLGGKVHFLDATEEEVVDLVRSLLFQLEIMASCLAMPPQQRKMLRANIGSFEAYLNCHPPSKRATTGLPQTGARPGSGSIKSSIADGSFEKRAD